MWHLTLPGGWLPVQVGMAALHIASKYEEVWPPPAAEWLMMSAGAYTK
jgi:hypothetical protein